MRRGYILIVAAAIDACVCGWYFDEQPALSLLLFVKGLVCYVVGEGMVMEGWR